MGDGTVDFEGSLQNKFSSEKSCRYLRDYSARCDVFMNYPVAVKSNVRASGWNTVRVQLDNDIKKGNDDEEDISFAMLQQAKHFSYNRVLGCIFSIYCNEIWQIFMLIILLIGFFINSMLYTFYAYEELQTLILADFLIDLILLVNVTVMLLLKYWKHWSICNIQEPGTHRIIFDVIITLPYSITYMFYNPNRENFVKYLPLVSLFRIYNVPLYFWQKTKQAGGNQWSLFIFQYLTLLYVAVHAWTCIWFHFAYKQYSLEWLRESWASTLDEVTLPSESMSDWYFLSTYYSIMMLTTAALGDLYPIGAYERIAAIIALLFGFCLTTTVFVGSLTSQFTNVTARRAAYVQQLKSIRAHLLLIDLNPTTTNRILSYYNDLWYEKSGVYKPTFFKLLPMPLQMEICFDINVVPLFNSLVFRKMPESFLRRLSLEMTHQFYLEGDIMFEQNQYKTMMVCISSGVLEFLSDEDDESPMISFTAGTCFGELSLIYNIPARCLVRAATYVECQILENARFMRLMMMYPNYYDDIRNELNSRISACFTRETFDHKAEITLNLYVSKSRYKSPIKLLKQKLREIQCMTPQDEDEIYNKKFESNYIDLYILSEHVKKEEVRHICITSKFPWIIDPRTSLAKFWEYYMLCISLFICIAFPYYFGFERSFPKGPLFLFAETILTLSLVVNIYMSATTAIKTRKRLLKTVPEILKYRMSTIGFHLDLIALIPMEFIAGLGYDEIYTNLHLEHLYYTCKVNKLCLVWRISLAFQRFENRLLANIIVIKVLKYCTFIALLAYFSGVVLYMESCYLPRCTTTSWFANMMFIESTQPQFTEKCSQTPFITSVYFATSIITSVSFGDLLPGDFYDLLTVSFLSLYGIFLIGFCIAEFSAVVTHWSRTKTAFLEAILSIERFMTENNMPENIKRRVMAFYELQWDYNKGVELTNKKWLEQSVAPKKLRREVLHQERFTAITTIPLFQTTNKEFVQKITERSRVIVLPPGEVVRYGGSLTRELYIIHQGYCYVHGIEEIEGQPAKKILIGPGAHFGLMVMLYGLPANTSVVTVTHCKVICIDHPSYMSALSVFPEQKEHDGLMSADELAGGYADAQSYNVDVFIKEHNKRHGADRKMSCMEVIQEFINSSIIDVQAEYKKCEKSYWESFHKFKHLRRVSQVLLMPYILKPDGPLLRIWMSFRVVIAFLICMLTPIHVSLAPTGSNFDYVLLSFDFIAIIDIYLMFHIGIYGNKNQLIYHPYLTAKEYLKGGFTLDILSSFPWEVFFKGIIPDHTEGHSEYDHFYSPHVLHCAIRLMRMGQIVKVLSVFWFESNNMLRRAYIMNVVQFMVLTVIFLNMWTCIFLISTCRYVMADNRTEYKTYLLNLEEGSFISSPYLETGNMICKAGSWFDKSGILKKGLINPGKVYLVAFYWAAGSMCGCGFGDVTAQNSNHMIISVCIMIQGSLFFGYVYASIAALKAVADMGSTEFQERMKHLTVFLNTENVSVHLKKDLIGYWNYQWKRTGGSLPQEILGKLHSNLNEDAVLFLYERILREMPLFENVEKSFFRVFAKRLQERYFTKGHVIMRANEVLEYMYIIYRGKVDVTTEYNEIEACMGPGGIFGNIVGARKFFTMSTISASKNLDVLVISGSEFYSILKSYPNVMRKVRIAVQSAARDYVTPTSIIDDLDENAQTYRDDSSWSDSSGSAASRQMTVHEDRAYSFLSHGERSIKSQGEKGFSGASTWLCLLMPHRWFRTALMPDSCVVVFLDYLILSISYADFIINVYQMSFFSIAYFMQVAILFDIIFFFKFFIDMHTGYVNRYGDYILDPKKIRNMYFSRRWARRCDLVVNAPFCYLAYGLGLRASTFTCVFAYLRIVQLGRVIYLFEYQSQRKQCLIKKDIYIKMLTMFLWTSVLTHLCACLFYKISCLTPDRCMPQNWMLKDRLNLQKYIENREMFAIYVTAVWYIINLLTTTGVGDVTPQNNLEMVETILILIIIKFCIGLLIAEVSVMLTAYNSSLIAYDYGITELRDALRDMDISDHQMGKMWDYVRQLWNRQYGMQRPVFIKLLPFCLNCDVMRAVYGKHVKKSLVFTGTDDDFQRMLVMWMRHRVFFKGNYIVQDGDTDQNMYFIHRGEVDVLTVHANLTESVHDILGAGDTFGIAQGLFVGVPHHFSFRAKTSVDIVFLTFSDWKYLLDFYPASAAVIYRHVEEVYLRV